MFSYSLNVDTPLHGILLVYPTHCDTVKALCSMRCKVLLLIVHSVNYSIFNNSKDIVTSGGCFIYTPMWTNCT